MSNQAGSSVIITGGTHTNTEKWKNQCSSDEEVENNSAHGMKTQCRICHEDDFVVNMETSCSCNGSLKLAHRKYIQTWCNEKKDTTCEICHQENLVGYCKIVIYMQVLQTWAGEELVDPKKNLEDSCKSKCVKPLLGYQACSQRVEGDETGNKHCTGQYFDYWSGVDKCVAPKLFTQLK